MSPKQVLRLRKALGLTQQRLADMIGAQRHTVARWELGWNVPKGANRRALDALAEKAKKRRNR
jgi:DNA-binding transcriptional regulator YiaG